MLNRHIRTVISFVVSFVLSVVMIGWTAQANPIDHGSNKIEKVKVQDTGPIIQASFTQEETRPNYNIEWIDGTPPNPTLSEITNYESVESEVLPPYPLRC